MNNAYPKSVKKYMEQDELRSTLIGKIAILDEDIEDLERRLGEVLQIAINASYIGKTLSYTVKEIDWLDDKLLEITEKLRTVIEEYERGNFEEVLATLEEEAEEDGWDYVRELIPDWGENVYTKVWRKTEEA